MEGVNLVNFAKLSRTRPTAACSVPVVMIPRGLHDEWQA